MEETESTNIHDVIKDAIDGASAKAKSRKKFIPEGERRSKSQSGQELNAPSKKEIFERESKSPDFSIPNMTGFSELSEGLKPAQVQALIEMIDFMIQPNQRLFILKGYAGTGKSYLLNRYMKFVTEYLELRCLLTAPTNKATKILRQISPNARTIYSALNLSMSTDEDTKVMEYDLDMEKLKFDVGSVLCIDEASMLNTPMCDAVLQVARHFKLKVVAQGDPVQIRPVGEKFSPIWGLGDRGFTLKDVLRFDNQILTATTRIRQEYISVRKYKQRISDQHLLPSDHAEDNSEGVFRTSLRNFENNLREIAQEEGAEGFLDTRVVAWRNKTVNKYNYLIRNALGFKDEFCEGDLITLGSAVTDGSYTKNIVANTDDEFFIKEISTTSKEFYIDVNGRSDYVSISHYVLSLKDGPHINVVSKDNTQLEELLNFLARKARDAQKSKGGGRNSSILWRKFWEIKDYFAEVRYGYALTAHRIQGSTLNTVYIDYQDIMANPDKEESLQCLYVAASRPTTFLVTL